MSRHGWKSVVGALAGAALLTVTAASAQAQSVTTEKQTVTSPPAPPPVVQPVQPVPVQTVPVQAAPVAPAPPVRETKVVAEQRDQGSFMGTIARDTLFGGLTGALVGGAIYFISGQDTRPVTVAYWAAGGALVGAGVGVVEVMVREGRQQEAMSSMERKGSQVTGLAFVPSVVNTRF